MSKSYGNTISMRENPDSLVIKLKKMPTDPARVKRDDPGDPKNVQYGPCIKYIVQSRPLTGLKRLCHSFNWLLECKKPLLNLF